MIQREDRATNTLEDNYKAVHVLCDVVEKLENILLEALPEMDGAVSSLLLLSSINLKYIIRGNSENEIPCILFRNERGHIVLSSDSQPGGQTDSHRL